MTDLRDVIKLRKQYENRFAQEIVVTNGEIVARNGSTKVPGVPNHYWVIPLGEGEPVAVYNRNVKATRPGLAVQIGYAPNSTVLEILRTVIDANSQSEDTGGINLEPHAGSHRIDGDDPLFIETRAITSLLTYPTGQSGLSVHVSSYTYVDSAGGFTVFPGLHFFDLSGYKPLAGSLLALIYLDRTTNTLAVAVGATIPQDSRAFIPPAPDLPDGAIPSAFVRLGASATSLGWPDFIEARDFLGGGSGGGNAWPTAGQNLLGTTNYATVSLLTAVMSVGDIGYLGQRNSTEAVVHNVDDGTLQGVDADTVVFTNPIDVTASFFTLRPKLVSVSALVTGGGAYALKVVNSADIVNVKVTHDDVDDAVGFYSDGSSARLINCEAAVQGNVSGHAVHAVDFQTLQVYGGKYTASGTGNYEFYADTNAIIELHGPTCNGNFGGAGTVKGYYYTPAGELRFAPATSLQNGIWLLRATTRFRIYYDTYAEAYAAALDGDTILFGHGSYLLSVATSIEKSVTIEGVSPEATIITGLGDGPTFYSSTTDATVTITLRNLTIRNSGGGTSSGAFLTDQAGVVLDNVRLEKVSGSPTNGYALHAAGGSITLVNDCRLKATAGTNKYGLLNLLTSAATVTMHGGRIEGTTQDIYGDNASSVVTLIDVVLANSLLSWVGTLQGRWFNASGVLHAPESNDVFSPLTFMPNYVITPSIASNNLTVALKTLDGSDPSPAHPVVVRIGDVVFPVTAALSVTKNAGTNWLDLGSNELKTLGVDLFCYLIRETGASAGVKIGFSRIPYAHTMSDFVNTTTNARYIAGNWTNFNATDPVTNVGRFNAILGAGASYNWSLPATLTVVNRPIFHTRRLSYVPTVTSEIGTITTVGAVTGSYYYDNEKFHVTHSAVITVNGTGGTSVCLTIPISPVLTTEMSIGFEGGLTGKSLVGFIVGNQLRWRNYDGTYPGANGALIQGKGMFSLR